MAGLKKLAGAYLIVLAVVVAVFFIINTVLAESFDFDVVTRSHGPHGTCWTC